MAVVSLAGAGIVAAQTASAATAPSVKMTQPTFTSLTADGPGANQAFPMGFIANFTIPWTVTAPNGVCGQTLTDSGYDDEGGPNDPILGGPSYTYTLSKTARSWSGGDGEWLDFGRGGYSAYVTVKECNGVKVRSNPVFVVLDVGDDHNPNGATALSFSPGLVGPGYGNKGWATANCTCFLGGTTTWTSLKGASFSFLTPQPNDATGVRVALVMPKGPGRGSAAVYVDNKYKATVNTYAKTNVNGKIVYQILLTGKNTHVVRVVNLATAGHPRIDIDATIN